MTAKNVLPKVWKNGEWVELHIVTKAANVLTDDAKTLQQKIDDFTSHLADNVKHITPAERSAWNSAESNAKSYTDQQLTAKFTYLNVNMIDMAVELETLKGATLNGVTANIFIETFQNLDDINLMNGVYDSVNKRLVL